MDRLLAKYIYKTYYQLLKNTQFNLEISRLGWVQPADLPRQYILNKNTLIRKYLTIGRQYLYTDINFQRILCQVGYYGPACTTTSTTTTTTTT